MGGTEDQREGSKPEIDPKVASYNLYFFGEAGPQGRGNCLIGGLKQIHLLKGTFLGVTDKALSGDWERVCTLPPALLAPYPV